MDFCHGLYPVSSSFVAIQQSGASYYLPIWFYLRLWAFSGMRRHGGHRLNGWRSNQDFHRLNFRSYRQEAIISFCWSKTLSLVFGWNMSESQNPIVFLGLSDMSFAWRLNHLFPSWSDPPSGTGWGSVLQRRWNFHHLVRWFSQLEMMLHGEQPSYK